MRKIISLIFLGASIGCLIICFVWVFLALLKGVNNFILTGHEVISSVIGTIIIGLGFSLPTHIYEKEEIPLIFQTIIQMGIGFTILFIIGTYLNWIPVETGVWAIVIWITIAILIGFVIWTGFYFYFKKEAEEINKKIKE